MTSLLVFCRFYYQKHDPSFGVPIALSEIHMFVYFSAAVAEILIGLFVYTFFDPEKVRKMPPLLRWGWMDPDFFIFNPGENVYLIKSANRIVLKFCILTAALTVLNGLFNIYLGFPDLKEVSIISTVIGAVLIRYAYIFLNKW